MVAPLVMAAGITAGASMLGGMMGNRQSKRNTEAQLQNAREDRVWNAEQAAIARSEGDRYQREMLRDQFQIMSQGARKAGIHPLAAMGMPAVPGPGTVIPGQSNLGSIQKDEQASGQIMAQAAIDGFNTYQNMQMQQAQMDNINADTALKLSAVNRNTQAGKPGMGSSNANVHAKPYVQEPLDKGEIILPGQVDSHDPTHPEKSDNIVSPMSRMRLGSQHIWTPTTDMDTFLEDPVMTGLAIWSYHGNRNVDWAKAAREWWSGSPQTKKEKAYGAALNAAAHIQKTRGKPKKAGYQSGPFYPHPSGRK